MMLSEFSEFTEHINGFIMRSEIQYTAKSKRPYKDDSVNTNVSIKDRPTVNKLPLKKKGNGENLDRKCKPCPYEQNKASLTLRPSWPVYQ